MLSLLTGYYDGALLYPMDNYFNLVGTGPNPLSAFSGPPMVNGTLYQTKSTMAYVAPFDGKVVSVNVNSAYSLNYYSDAEFDFIILTAAGVGVAGQTSWGGGYVTARVLSGFSQTFAANTFVQGDLIFCYIVNSGLNNWNQLPPVPADDGGFNVTLYLQFT